MAVRSLAIPLRLVAGSTTHRGPAPVTMGVPFPEGSFRSADQLVLEEAPGRSVPLQVTVLDRWSDGSARWALLDYQVVLGSRGDHRLVVHQEPQSPEQHRDPIVCDEADHSWTVATAHTRVRLGVGESLPIARVSSHFGDSRVKDTTTRLVVGIDGEEYTPRADRIAIETLGPLRTTLRSEGSLAGPHGARLDFSTRVTRYAGLPCCRVSLSIRNPRRSRHRGGKWVLGDPGSLLLQHVSVDVGLPKSVATVLCSTEPGEAPETCQVPFLLYQDSSGGAHWASPVHRNRHGEIRYRFRGYQLRDRSGVREGLRATPLIAAVDREITCSLAVPHFWQNCPRALAVSGEIMRFGMFPEQYDDLHELQGGEQKTHEFFIAVGSGSTPADALEWCREPLIMAADPQWYAAAEAAGFLTTAADDPHRTYVALGQAAVDGPEAFAAKAERVDEFGWRHFGDLYADHEAVHQPPGSILVSHYNNQYDAIAGFAVQYLRTADPRWWTLMDALAAHVADIDVYHTSDDKAAYNGGLFWHTQHYIDAGTSTHRTYPLEDPGGGGPSAEHNYTTGLMLHHFLTGSCTSRETVIGLADWVLRMDDGDSTVFRWLARGPTGLASATGSELYHGPGRGSANSIVACLDAWRLTRDRRYDEKAVELLRRCIHPQDDLAALEFARCRTSLVLHGLPAVDRADARTET